MTEFVHVQLVIGHVVGGPTSGRVERYEVRHSRYPETQNAEQAWFKLMDDVACEWGPEAELVAVILDEPHAHPLAMVDGVMFAPEHMP